MEEAKAEIGRVNAEARHKKRQEAKKLVKGKSLTPPDQRVRVVTPEEVRKARKEKRRKSRKGHIGRTSCFHCTSVLLASLSAW